MVLSSFSQNAGVKEAPVAVPHAQTGLPVGFWHVWSVAPRKSEAFGERRGPAEQRWLSSGGEVKGRMTTAVKVEKHFYI